MHLRLFAFLLNIKCYSKGKLNLFNLVDLIQKYLNTNYYVCGVFIDFQKVFGTVNQDILLEKCAYYGLPGLANNWLSSFFKNRKQYIFSIWNFIYN